MPLLLCCDRCWPNDGSNVDDEYSGQCKEVSSHAKGVSYFENGIVFNSTLSIPPAFDTLMEINFRWLKLCCVVNVLKRFTARFIYACTSTCEYVMVQSLYPWFNFYFPLFWVCYGKVRV